MEEKRFLRSPPPKLLCDSFAVFLSLTTPFAPMESLWGGVARTSPHGAASSSVTICLLGRPLGQNPEITGRVGHKYLLMALT